MGPWYVAARRVPRVRRDARAQPAARACGRRPLRRRHGRRLPARHVRPRRPDAPAAPASSASSTRWCGGACRRPSTAAAFWWTAPDGSTVRAEYLPAGLRQRRPRARRRQGARAPHRRVRARSRATCSPGPILWMNGTDHLHAAAVARAAWWPRPTTLARRLRARTSARWPSTCSGAPTEGLPDVDGRAALRRPRQPAHGRGVEPRRREAGRRPRRARARAAGRAAVGAVPPGRPAGPARCSTRPGSR